nr:hypothetical protein [Tanacetum cinerariifolium]
MMGLMKSQGGVECVRTCSDTVPEHLDLMPSGAATLAKHVVDNSRKGGASLSSDNEDEEEEAEVEDNGLRVCLKDVIVKTSQKHSKWHGTIAFNFDFLHSIKNHQKFVEVSLKLSLSGSRNGDVFFDEIMLRAKEMTIRMIIKRV